MLEGNEDIEVKKLESLNNSSLIIEKDNNNSKIIGLSKIDNLKQQSESKKPREEKVKRELDKKKKESFREEDRKRKEAEKEQERKKKEFEKDEEKRKRDEERKKKDEEKRLKQAEKDEEKRRKEEEKKLKDAEREEDKRKKDEEKRIKDAEREEEKRKKEEEKRRREDEKRKEENEKKRQRAIILDFVLKKDKAEQDIVEISHDLQTVGFFKPIELKKDMRLATVERIKKPLIESLAQLGEQAYTFIDEIDHNKVDLCVLAETWPISEPECEVVESSVTMRFPTKSFLFNENVRPPFYGTWKKTSKLINGLNPLAEDISFFDYDIDSDQEWEYESGEDISNSEGEEEEDGNDDNDDNSFVVPHGYLSEGEDCSDVDVDVTHESTTINKRSLSPSSRQTMIEIREKQFQAEVKQKVQTINPNIIGPYFTDIENSKQIQIVLEPYRMIYQYTDGLPINCNLQSDFDNAVGSAKIKSVPVEAIPHLIRLLHHNALSRAKICYEFRMFWEYHLTSKLPEVTFDDDIKGKDWDEFTIGKKRLIDTIKRIAERKEGKWIVKPDIIHEYQLSCIDDDPSKQCSCLWKYVSDILNIEMPKKMQRKVLLVDDQNQNIIPKEPKKTKKRKQLIELSGNIKLKTLKSAAKKSALPLSDNTLKMIEELRPEARHLPVPAAAVTYTSKI